MCVALVLIDCEVVGSVEPTHPQSASEASECSCGCCLGVFLPDVSSLSCAFASVLQV